MGNIVQDILDRNLQDFKGARIMGVLSLSDALVNEVIQLSMKTVMKGTTEVARPAEGPAAAPKPEIDIDTLLAQLNIEKLHYRTAPGQTQIDLQASLKS